MANPQPHQTQPDPIYENIGDASAFRDIYYLSPDGNVSCGSTKPIEGELKKYADVFSPPTLGLKLATQKYQEATPSAASDSRLTLMSVILPLEHFNEGSNCFKFQISRCLFQGQTSRD